MNKETIEFYDKESAIYSEKRYPKITQSFTQYLFKTRKYFFLKRLGGVLGSMDKNPSVLEIGCADGILLQQMEDRFPDKFEKLVGVDISSKMIWEAVSRNQNPKAKFFLRDNIQEERFDIVIELGVHPFNLSNELEYVRTHLNPGGFFFYSVVGANSLHVRLKMRDKEYTKDYLDYQDYEREFLGHYSILSSDGYGIFIPKVWSLPTIARIIQPIVDKIFSFVMSSWYHEKIYLLRSNEK